MRTTDAPVAAFGRMTGLRWVKVEGVQSPHPEQEHQCPGFAGAGDSRDFP